MSAATWMKDLEAAIVSSWNADADMLAVVGLPNVGKIEVGLTLPMRTQEIQHGELPYLGVKITAFSRHLGNVPGGAVGFSVHDCTVRTDIQFADGQQKDAEAKVKDILATLAHTVGSQRKTNPYSLDTGRAKTLDLEPGEGELTAIERDGETNEWIVEGQYVFTVRIRLKNQP